MKLCRVSEHILHGSTGPVLNFGKEKVVSISTRSWRVMYPCVRTQRYDRKPLPFARAFFSYLCSAVMMRLRSLSAAWPHRVVSLTLML